MPGRLGPHEALQLHEVLRTEALSAMKIQAMRVLATDPELKSYMARVLARKRERVRRLQELARQGQ